MKFNKRWFERHQRALIILLNLPVFGQILRRAMWIQELWLPIAKITPSAVHYWLGEDKFKAEISSGYDHAEGLRASFYPFWALIHAWDMLIANRWMPSANLGFDTLNEEADTNNTMIQGLNTSYATARSTATGHFTNESLAAYRRLGQLLSGGTYACYRIALMFDTSSLVGATINQANLSCAIETDASTTDFTINIVKAAWGSNDPVSAGNRDAVYDAILAASLDVAWRSTSGISADTPYSSPNLDVAYINKSGSTYYGLVSSRDVGNNTPAGNEWVVLYLQNAATSAYRPRLIVEYVSSAGWWYFF